MVVGEAAAAAAAAGAHSLFSYNRENFLYDRKQRQEAEFKILEWRCTQAELWRDDIRDIIGLTEKKMDTYLIVSTLQLGMCVGLFSEGRLEPGTPTWLLHFYMLTLGAAFMYHLMSVWLAMHASIVASCSSVRLLTQFVRLPVPTWEEVEKMRTYGQSVENLEARHLLRVPFTGHSSFGGPSSASASSSSGLPHQSCADPWGLELNGLQRDIYELTEEPAALRRHVAMASRAARQYQCFDAFARVAMSFGTNQLLNAIGYYVLGYVCVQDGAPFPAWCVVIVMGGIAMALSHLDFSLTRKESMLAKVLIIAGPAFSSMATCAWTLSRGRAENLTLSLLPAAYASHGLWLFFALNSCGIALQPNGAWLPEKFRAVLYLDVFGWLRRRPPQEPDLAEREVPSINGFYSAIPQGPDASDPEPALAEQLEALRRDVALFQSEKVRCVMTEEEKARADRLIQRIFNSSGGDMEKAPPCSSKERDAWEEAPLVCLKAPTDVGTEMPYFLDVESGEVSYAARKPSLASSDEEEQKWGRQCRSLTGFEEDFERYITSLSSREARSAAIGKAPPSGEHPEAPEHSFKPESYGVEGSAPEAEEVVTGHSREHPGRLPAKLFRLSTAMLIILWAAGMAMPFGVFKEFAAKPLTAEIPVETGLGRRRHEEHLAEPGSGAQGGLEGLQDFHPGAPLSRDQARKERKEEEEEALVRALPEGELVEAAWPSHSGFVPRALSCDPSGQRLVVADDLGVYAGRLSRATVTPPILAGEDRPSPTRPPATTVKFERVPPCAALEGQELKDIGIVCKEGNSEDCAVAVLHAGGRRLAQCRLPSMQRGAEEVQPTASWTIASDWLHYLGRRRREYVEAIAIEDHCLLVHRDASEGTHVQRMRDRKGCGVVVGTTSGRIVQLRAALADRHRLVPERAMQSRRSSVGQGSLHVFRHGLVLSLRRDTGVVQAFNTLLGTSVGKWQLPAGPRWLTLCGGGDSLFVLGRRNHSHTELYRFPVPASLQEVAPGSVTEVEAPVRLLEM